MSRSLPSAAATALVFAGACGPGDAVVEPPGIVLALAGDVMLGRGVDQIMPRSVDPILYERHARTALDYVRLAEEAHGPIPRNVDPAYVWGDALEVLASQRPVARIVNLETAVTTAAEPWPGKGIHYRTHPANTAVLAAAGIDCAVVANNHVLDWGRPGLLETLESLRGAGIAAAGAGSDEASAAAPTVLELSTRRVLVFAAAHGSSGVPAAWAAGEELSGVHLLEDLSVSTAEDLARRIARVKRPGDLVVVSVHWGGNWGYRVPPSQERFARALVEAGAADVIHGHSSHHPKGIEVHEGRLVLYGSGDLLNDYEGIGGKESFRPDLSFLYFPRLDASGRLLALVLAPMRIEKLRLRRADAEETAWLAARLARESRGVDVEVRGDLIVATPLDDRP